MEQRPSQDPRDEKLEELERQLVRPRQVGDRQRKLSSAIGIGFLLLLVLLYWWFS